MATGTPRTQSLATPLRYRRNIARLTPEQLALLRDGFRAVMGIGDDRGYGYYAGIHGLPLPLGCRNAHGTPLFLPWHRAYLYSFERAIRDQVPDAMTAWWDWRTPPGQVGRIPSALGDRRDLAGQPNPLHSVKVDPLALRQGRERGVRIGATTRRSPSSQAAQSLPTPQEVKDLLAIRDFGTFSDVLDSIHGGVHMWVGGHMTEIDFAAFDPIFWAHHGMVDRLWRMWQVRHGRAGPPESIWDQALPPFGLTVRRTLSVTALGYDYAGITASRKVGS